MGHSLGALTVNRETSMSDDSRDLTSEMHDLLVQLQGKRLSMPGGAGRFEVVEVGGQVVRVLNGTNLISIPTQWFDDAWRVLHRDRVLTRKNLAPDARFRSGQIFGIIALHPNVVVQESFPRTKLALREQRSPEPAKAAGAQ